MYPNGKLFYFFAALVASCLVIDAKPIRLDRRHAQQAKAATADIIATTNNNKKNPVLAPAEQNMFDFPMEQVDGGASVGGSSSSGESSQESDLSMEEGGDGAADYTADNPEPIGNNRANGGQLPIFGSPKGANPDMMPIKKGSSSGSSVGIAFAVLALIGVALGVTVYVIKRNKLNIPFIKLYN